MSCDLGLFGGSRINAGKGARLACIVLAAMLLMRLPAAAQEKPKLPDAKTRDTIARKALTKVPPHIDASPLPRHKGDFVSLGADGLWNRPAEGTNFLTADMTGSQGPAADCSREAIVHYAKAAPSAFEPGNAYLMQLISEAHLIMKGTESAIAKRRLFLDMVRRFHDEAFDVRSKGLIKTEFEE